MIDIFISFGRKEPADGPLIPKYDQYVHQEKVSRWPGVYFYSNSFDAGDHERSIYTDRDHIFFLFGCVFLRNAIRPTGEVKPLSAREVFKIVTDTSEEFHSIKGNYAYVFFRRSDSFIKIVNSPFGVFPLNYSIQDGQVFISSSLAMILRRLRKKTVNTTALIQMSMFDTMLGSNTLIREIRQLQYGQMITFYPDGRIYESYIYPYNNLISPRPLSRDEALPGIATSLKRNSELLPFRIPFLLGLTGGYDCRLNFALVPPDLRRNIISYTYGMATSPEIRIARKIARQFGLRHEAIILGKDYEREYVANAEEVLRLGDGFTPFMRVNYLYTHRRLSILSRDCVTGMFGSEFIKPMHVMADSVSLNSSTVSAFLSSGIVDSLAEYFRRLRESPDAYYRKEIYSEVVLDETIDFVRRRYLEGMENYSAQERLFIFYMHEGMRKFFMELIRIDRMFVRHHLPYLDIDFLEPLLSSCYAGVYNNVFCESLLKRRKGQLFYADAMNLFNPALNDISVDRGYKPRYLRNRLGWIRIGLGYIARKRLARALLGNTTFNTKKWRSMVYNANRERLAARDPYFNDRMHEKFLAGYYLQHEHVYARHVSLKMWLNEFI